MLFGQGSENVFAVVCFRLVAKGTQGSGNKVYQTDPDASDLSDVLNVIIKTLNILLDYSV